VNLLFVADENFNGKLLKALLDQIPTLDIIRVQDTEMYKASDPDLLEWTAQENRILLTHDVNTITKYAYERIHNGQYMSGVIEVRMTMTIGELAEQLYILILASEPDEFHNLIRFIPF